MPTSDRESSLINLSVVMPVWNEARAIPDAIAGVRAACGPIELVVVDGGSDDDSAAVARAAGADRVLVAPRGRGVQMRAGAEVATGDALMFLHVDCRLPSRAVEHVEDTLRRGFDGGVFRVRHVASPSASWPLRLCLRAANLRSRGMRLPYGDQALFLSRNAYDAVGGMPAQALMEDVELGRRLRGGRFRIRRLPQEVTASGRRFEAAPLFTLLCWSTFPSLYVLGVPAERLHRWYGRAAAKPGRRHRS